MAKGDDFNDKVAPVYLRQTAQLHAAMTSSYSLGQWGGQPVRPYTWIRH